MARILKVNEKTAVLWWNQAVEKRIIFPPFLRKRAFENFKEYFQFYIVQDPHLLYKTLQEDENVMYLCVLTGVSNVQVVSKEPILLNGKSVLTGVRSDYLVSHPVPLPFKSCVPLIERKLHNLDSFQHSPSPLVYHTGEYQPWDDVDERIYTELCNDMRRPFLQVFKNVKTYSDKIQSWFKRRDEFGQTMMTFFPEGESSYLPSLFFVKTDYDSLIIDIFSTFPVTNVFYRIGDVLVMCLYLPFSLEGRYFVREALSILKKEELVESYTNSIVEYGYRPDLVD